MSAQLAVVYSDDSTGPRDGDDTGATMAMLATGRQAFEVVTAGPRGDMTVREALARHDVGLYVQPGADGDDDQAFRRQKRDKGAIRRFVASGGRYLGICMGAFLAEPGHFNIFPGRVGEYYSSKGASVTTDDPAIVTVSWRGTPRRMYFQDGGFMVPRRRAQPGTTVLARYSNGAIAAVVTSFGQGRVGLSGPHPEAPPAWYREADLDDDDTTQDLADDLVDTLMAP